VIKYLWRTGQNCGCSAKTLQLDQIIEDWMRMFTTGSQNGIQDTMGFGTIESLDAFLDIVSNAASRQARLAGFLGFHFPGRLTDYHALLQSILPGEFYSRPSHAGLLAKGIDISG
jgi:hypothetical protein